MPITKRQVLLTLAASALHPAQVFAAPRGYRLDPETTRVGFTFEVGGVTQIGQMPVLTAKIAVDPVHLEATQVDVTLGASRARTGFILATQAMLSPEILDAERHPTIRFVSTGVQLASDGRLSGGARLSGDLTLRGITQPIVLQADIHRPRGSAPTDLSHLQIQLRGDLSRSRFGATGYADLVADTVALDIRAGIRAG